MSKPSGLVFKVSLAAPDPPSSNAYLAKVADALSTEPRLYADIMIDEGSKDRRGVEEDRIRSVLENRFGDKTRIKLSRDVFEWLDNAFLAKRWGGIIKSDVHRQARWVSTPVGDPVGDEFRILLGPRPSANQVKTVAERLRQVAHESRIAILRRLELSGIINRDELLRLVLPRSSIGFHLSKLKAANIIDIEPSKVKVERNQLPDTILQGKSFDEHFRLVEFIISGVRRAPPLELYPVWYFMQSLPSDTRLDTVSGGRNLHSKILSLSPSTARIMSFIDWGKTDQEKIETISPDTTVQEFLEKGVENAYVATEDRLEGVLNRTLLTKDLIETFPARSGKIPA